ncbi:MAG TPA: cytochrome c3 family protein [Gemmatimonadaceae bacterium]|nr:cytochrome c3 family protein [Gemmatimonadaceae bacterium]
MPALFPRWTNIVARGSLLAIFAIAGGVPIALMVWVRTSYATGEHANVTQPVPFDHRVHTAGLGLDCRYCHATVMRAASAGFPPSSACIGCHRPSIVNSTMLTPVRNSIATQRPVAWRRVDALPDFVFFNHSIHVAKGIGCETCHGRVARMGQVAQAAPLSMRWCLDCHRDPTPHIRPREAVTIMGWDAAHGRPRADSLGVRLAQLYGVRRLTSCTTCHR